MHQRINLFLDFLTHLSGELKLQGGNCFECCDAYRNVQFQQEGSLHWISFAQPYRLRDGQLIKSFLVQWFNSLEKRKDLWDEGCIADIFAFSSWKFITCCATSASWKVTSKYAGGSAGTFREDCESGGRELISEAARETWGTPLQAWVFGADEERVEVDWDAKPVLPVEEAGLTSEMVKEDAYLESGSQLCFSVMLKRFNRTSGTDESGISLAESSPFSLSWAALSEAIFDKASLMALHSPSSQGSITSSNLRQYKIRGVI